nr:hypothetical protein [Tanacetum cinerariifolium]
MSAEQAFWLPLSNPKSEQLNVTQKLVKIEVPKELPKVSLVNISFQKLKNQFVRFDKVVKVRTTPDVRTKGSWGFEHTKQVFKEEVMPFINYLRASFNDFENGLHSELNEVKTMFNQMKATVDQCSIDKNVSLKKSNKNVVSPENVIVLLVKVRYIDTKPNHELIHYCLKNPPYKLTWADKEVPISKGSSVTTTERYMETYKNVLQDIRDQLNAEAKAVQTILTGIDNDIYSTIDACPNACET